MSCKRCPHHVRHGHLDTASGNIVFDNLCGLKIKQLEREEAEKQSKRGPDKRAGAVKNPPRTFDKSFICEEFPFEGAFDYMLCNVYIETFKSGNRKKDVVPTKDFQYSEAFAGGSITDMELL